LRRTRRWHPDYYAAERKLYEQIALIEAVIYARDETLSLWSEE